MSLNRDATDAELEAIELAVDMITLCDNDAEIANCLTNIKKKYGNFFLGIVMEEIRFFLDLNMEDGRVYH